VYFFAGDSPLFWMMKKRRYPVDFTYPLPQDVNRSHWMRYKWAYLACSFVVLALVVWYLWDEY
jgi:hypothetical protein